VVVVFLPFCFLPALAPSNRISAQLGRSVVIFTLFLFQLGYFTLFEAFWNGERRAKRVSEIRVIQRPGGPLAGGVNGAQPGALCGQLPFSMRRRDTMSSRGSTRG